MLRITAYSTKEVDAMICNLEKQGIVDCTDLNGGKQKKIAINEEEAVNNFEHLGFLHPLSAIQHYVSEAGLNKAKADRL